MNIRSYHDDKSAFDNIDLHSLLGISSSLTPNNTIEKKFKDGHVEIWSNISIKNGRFKSDRLNKATKTYITKDGHKIVWKGVNINRNGQIRATNSCDIKYVTENEILKLIGVKIRDGGRVVKSNTPIIVIKHDLITGKETIRPVEIMQIYDEEIPCFFSVIT